MELLKSITAEIAEKEDLKALEEAGLLQKGLSKAAGAVGMKKTAANLQARGDAKQKIEQLKVAFNQFAGQMGKKANNASAGDLATFFKSKNLPIADEIQKMKNQPLNQTDKAVVAKAFQTAIQGGAKRQMRQQAAQPAQQQQGQQQQPQQGGNVVDKMKQFASSLSASQKNSFIAALQA